MADLALVVPSRGRPQNIQRLIDAMTLTCLADTELIVGVDLDDPTLPDYGSDRGRVRIVHCPRMPLVAWLNFLASECDAPLIGHIGDDNVPRTEGWDLRIIESLERQGEISFCFGDDLDPGRAPGSLSIHIFMTAEVIRRLGYMGPPQIQHMYVDPVWYAWGQATSIEFLPDVVLEHLHYTLGKASADESYRQSTGLIPTDLQHYKDYCSGGLNVDIEKLGGTPFTAEALAEFNRELNIPA
jgi:hypothetical protein